MNLIEDPLLVTPPSLSPDYQQKKYQFVFQLPLTNHHHHPIHFYVDALLTRSSPPSAAALPKPLS